MYVENQNRIMNLMTFPYRGIFIFLTGKTGASGAYRVDYLCTVS